MKEIHRAIEVGADAFLKAGNKYLNEPFILLISFFFNVLLFELEYGICAYFVIGFAPIVFFTVSFGSGSSLEGGLTSLAFILGAFTSIACGYIGMKVAVFSNVRTTIGAQKGGYMEAFNAAFRGGSVVGFALTGGGLLGLYSTLLFFKMFFHAEDSATLMSCVAGYGLGGSAIALFGRVGGGIYTKVKTSFSS